LARWADRFREEHLDMLGSSTTLDLARTRGAKRRSRPFQRRVHWDVLRSSAIALALPLGAMCIPSSRLNMPRNGRSRWSYRRTQVSASKP